jgi:NAD(P)-dependent dehydrogenase (short-subunit alcohol dehydrogenase family)/acyl carrier protein
MIETEETGIDAGTGCDGRCEVRLLQTLQKAIGDILSEHARSTKPGPRIEAFANESAPGRGIRGSNGSDPVANRTAGSAAGMDGEGAGKASAVAPSRAEAAKIVVDTVADITRYPREILTPEARFDDDLGIDSLKRAEIVTALLNHFGEAPPDLKTLGPPPLTVGEMIDFALTYVTKSSAAVAKDEAAASDTNARRSAPAAPQPPADVSVRPTTLSRAAPELPRPGPVRAGNVAADRPLEGRVALITGSGDGLGKIIARQMTELGAQVIINPSHSREHAEETNGEILAGNGKATHAWSPLASSDHIERSFREIEERFDRLDYYVRDAADQVISSLDKATDSQWENAFRSNVIAYHQSAIRAAKLMQKSGGGRIVAISSAGTRRYMQHYGVMGPVNAALETLTMYLAQELAPYNVQVNAVAACPSYGEQPVPHPESRRGDGWLGNPEEISEAVIFLLTTAARINGSTMVVDGGWSQRL